jgi:hypothetical protein
VRRLTAAFTNETAPSKYAHKQDHYVSAAP